MKRLTFIILLALISVGANSQDLKVEIVTDGDELTLCPKTKYTFYAKATADGGEVEADYTWDFDNGDVFQTYEDYIEHRYNEGGAYIIKVSAKYNGMTASDKIRAKVGKAPSFKDYTSDVDEKLDGICLGETVKLTMPISEREVEYAESNTVTENTPEPFYASEWTETVTFRNLDGKSIQNADNIKSVSVTLVHSDSKDLQLALQSPDGKTVTLKSFSDSGLPMGIPVEGKSGTHYIYTFTDNAAATINATATTSGLTEIPSGEYLPEDGFANLVGTEVNGDWKLVLTSRGTDSEGYVSEFTINLSDDMKDGTDWTYTQTYDLRRAVWAGKGVSATSAGIAEATPQDYGTTRYSFAISDDFGCSHDTAVYIEVEEPTFSNGDSAQAFIGDEINFENTTSWAVEQVWSFGDDSKAETGNPAPHAYYEKGTYQIIMESISDSGCSDRDTQSVKIVPRPLEIKEVNIFTPNGDGVNDVFTFFDPDDSFLSNGGLTKMPANIRSIKCKIYNSYGQTICKWDEVRPSVFGWDGTLDNDGKHTCPPGTYFYDIIVYGKDGNSVKRSGTIFLYDK